MGPGMPSALGVLGVCRGPCGDQVVGWKSAWVRVGEAWAQVVRVKSSQRGSLGLGSPHASGPDPSLA